MKGGASNVEYSKYNSSSVHRLKTVRYSNDKDSVRGNSNSNEIGSNTVDEGPSMQGRIATSSPYIESKVRYSNYTDKGNESTVHKGNENSIVHTVDKGKVHSIISRIQAEGKVKYNKPNKVQSIIKASSVEGREQSKYSILGSLKQPVSIVSPGRVSRVKKQYSIVEQSSVLSRLNSSSSVSSSGTRRPWGR